MKPLDSPCRVSETPSFARRWLLRIVLIAAVLGAVLWVAVFLVGRCVTPEFIASRASAALGHAVTVDSVRLAFRPGLRIRAEVISVVSGPTAQAAELRPAWGSLLRGDVRLGGVRLEGLKLALVRDANGTVKVQGWDAPVCKDQYELSTLSAPMPLPRLPSIELVDSDLTWIDHRVSSGALTASVSLERARLRGFREDGTARFTVRGAIVAAERRGGFVLSGHAGPLRASIALAKQPFSIELETRGVEAASIAPYLPASWDLPRAAGPIDANVTLHRRGSGEVEGRLRIALGAGFVEFANFRFAGPGTFRSGLRWADDALTLSNGRLETATATRGDRRVQQLRARFDYHEPTLTLEPSQAKAFGGRLVCQGTIHFEDQTRLNLEVGLSGANFSQVIGIRDPDLPSSGRIDAHAKIRGLTGDPRQLRGVGRLSVHGGEMRSAGLTESVGSALSTFVPKWARREKPEAPPARTPLRRAIYPFTLEDGRARTESLEIVTDLYRIEGRGDFDLVDGFLNFETDVTFTAQGLEKVVSYAATASRLRPSQELPSVPINVSGPLHDVHLRPKLRAAPMASLAGVLWGAEAILDLPKGAARKVSELASRLGRTSEPAQDVVESRGDLNSRPRRRGPEVPPRR